MTSKNRQLPAEILAALEDCRALLSSEVGPVQDERTPALPLPSLMAQLGELVEDSRNTGRRPLGLVHHFACSGGTLISKCIASMPNVCLLSELDPLSAHGFDPTRPDFAPTDILRHLRYARTDTPADVVQETYLSALDTAYSLLGRSGRQIVIRDHTHSHYCTHADIDSRPTHLEIIQDRFDVRPILTVRNPVDSYISLQENGWIMHHPPNFDEYCRRYLRFLDDHRDVPLYKYEDIIASPRPMLQAICSEMQIDYDDGFEAVISVIPLTGDSGRMGTRISHRPPKPRPASLLKEMDDSSHYSDLISRLAY